MAGGGPSRTRKHRHCKACTRCRRKKIRCDLQYPTCGACSASGTTCVGFDSIHGTDKPRSTISFLEEEVARLEIELRNVKTQNRSISDSANAAVERLTTRLAMAIVEPRGRSARKQENYLPLTSPFFLSGSPAPYFTKESWENTKYEPGPERPVRAITVFSIPRHVIDAMLKHYCEIYRPQYPAIEEADLYKACDKVYTNSQPSGFDIFCVYITLAISTTTLMHQDEKQAITATNGFWAAARNYLNQIGLENPWERLQALQLLAHYAFLNPKDVDCEKCAAAGMRLCLQLGLQHELPVSTQIKHGISVVNVRRRLFWNAYGIDVAVHQVRCRPYLLPMSIMTTKFPDFDSPSSPTPHVWTLRQIESEVTYTLYYPLLKPDETNSGPGLTQWFANTHERLYSWHQRTRQSVDLTEKIEFHELHFHLQILKLNRPTPRNRSPTIEMHKRALKSAIALVREFSVIERLGKLFYIWHAAYCLVEAGIYMLASVLVGLESLESDRRQVAGEDVAILTKYIKTFPSLLWKMSRRWSNIEQHASVLESIASSALELLQRWTNGGIVRGSEVEGLKQRLDQHAEFSPFAAPIVLTPTAGLPSLSHAISSNGDRAGSYSSSFRLADPAATNNGYPRSHENGHYSSGELTPASANAYPPPVNQVNPVGSAGFQVSISGTSTSFPSAGLLDPPALEPIDSMFPGHYGVNGGEGWEWDFAGMDYKELFAALLEGGGNPLLDDLIVS